MADSVRERIMKNLQAALEAITVANGFGNTLNSVQRLLQRGQSFNPPMALLMEGNDEASDGPLNGNYGLVSRTLNIDIALIVQQDEEQDARSASEVMNSLIADVQKKMQEDHRRGELAINTEEVSVSEIEVNEGMTQLGCTVSYRITYRHSRLDPTQAG